MKAWLRSTKPELCMSARAICGARAAPAVKMLPILRKLRQLTLGKPSFLMRSRTVCATCALHIGNLQIDNPDEMSRSVAALSVNRIGE